MGLFGNRTQQEIEEIEELLLLVLRDLSQLKPKPPRPRMVLISNFNNTKSIIMSLSIASNQKAAIIIGLVDATTLAPITATSTGETNSIDNTAAAETLEVVVEIQSYAGLAGQSEERHGND